MSSSAACVSLQTLSTSNQIAPRNYVRSAFCFPFADNVDNCRRAYKHVRASLDEIARDYPFLAGTIVPELNPSDPGRSQMGRMSLATADSDQIPLNVAYATNTFGWTYDELKARKFPQSAFVGNHFMSLDQQIDGKKRESALEVAIIFMKGGLIMIICNHHSVMDGGCRKKLFDLFAAYTKKEPYPGPLVTTQVDTNPQIERYLLTTFWENLFGKCSELAYLPDRSGPCQPSWLEGGAKVKDIEMTGKIFRFTEKKLKELRAAISMVATEHPDDEGLAQGNPSVYMTLAALTWAHITRARYETERIASEDNLDNVGTLMTPVSWRGKALKEGNEHYFGNAIATPFTVVPTANLFRACTSLYGLSELIHMISAAIAEVDEDYMNTRIALYKTVPDLRTMGLEFDLRNPQDYTFNTWRWFGGDVEWNIPGIQSTKAEAIRRVTEDHNLGAIVILPATHPSADQELYVELPIVSMERLCQDREWMQWVNEVVE